MAGLLDDERLTITRDGRDDLAFTVGEETWSTGDVGAVKGRKGTWCEVERWEGDVGRRVSRRRAMGREFLCVG